MYGFKPRDFIVVLLSAYFVLGYAVNIDEIEALVPGVNFVPLGILLAAWGSLFIRSIARKRFALFPARLRVFYVYVAVLLAVLVAVNLNALRPAYSISRAILSVGILALSIIFFWRVLQVIEQTRMRRGAILTYSLLTLLIILLLGQFTIPEWAAGIGGVRMSGGSNPNKLGLLGFFSIFWAHYSALKKNRWDKSGVYLYILALGVVGWSLSRSVIISLTSLYLLYFAIRGGCHIVYFFRGRIKLAFLRRIVVVGVFLLILTPVPIMKTVDSGLQDFRKVERRISSTDNIKGRLTRWKTLWPYIKHFPVTGRAGWWRSTDLVYSSPHSLYIRLLSEVGILGAMAVLSLPLFIVLVLFYRILFQRLYNNSWLTLSFLTSSLSSVFILQFAEDLYMVGLGGFSSGVVCFILVCAMNESLSRQRYVF